jgi:hypothetical protein
MEEERDLMVPDWQLPYFVALAPGSPETQATEWTMRKERFSCG